MIKIIYKGGGESLADSWEKAEEIGKGCAMAVFKDSKIKIFEFCIINFESKHSIIYECEKVKNAMSCTIY